MGPRKLVPAIAAAALLGAPALATALPFDLDSVLGTASRFTVLGLEGGTVTINSATSITGDVGYADGVVSNTNQKVDVFDGAALVHSGATFNSTPATFAPSDGVQTGPAVDAVLDRAHADAVAASALLAALSESNAGVGHFQEISLGALGDDDDRTVSSTGGVHLTRVNLDSLDYKEDALTIVGEVGDVFVFNVDGSFDFSNSRIVLQGGVSALDVVFNFVNASAINVNKAGTQFNGRILAPLGTVDYHNPATFDGAIIASSITLHSDFNIQGNAGVQVPLPAPAPLALLAIPLLGVAAARRAR